MRICVDPGHSDLDPGILGLTGLREADITLQLALQLTQYLTTLGHEVVLTRSSEQATAEIPAQDLRQRGSMANYTGCQVLVSIHGALMAEDLGGVAVQYLRGAGLSAQLAVLVHNQLLEMTTLKSCGVVSTQEINLLKKVRMPAIQVELVMFGNEQQETLLQDPSWLKTVVTACGDAIIGWQGKHLMELTQESKAAEQQTDQEPLGLVDDSDAQGETNSISESTDADVTPVSVVDASQPLPDIMQGKPEAQRKKAAAPIVVQAEIASGSGTSKPLSEEAQTRLSKLSHNAMERISTTAANNPRQEGAPGIITKTSVAISADNTLPRPKDKVPRRADTSPRVDADVSQNTGSDKGSVARIPVPVTRAPSSRAGAATPFRVSAVVQTAQGRKPAAVKVGIPAQAKTGAKASTPAVGAQPSPSETAPASS